MPGNPVQILLNDGDFLRAPDPMRAGPSKEFFPDDAAFGAHRARLTAMVERVIDTVKGSEDGLATYVRVTMRQEALAKSYRPTKALFPQDRFPCVGAEGIGVLFMRASFFFLPGLLSKIREAEARVRWVQNEKTDKLEPRPSRARSEIGAIASIEIEKPADKRSFSAAAAIQILHDPRTVSGYQIELFETRAPGSIADDPLGVSALQRSFRDLLLTIDGGRFLVPGPMGHLPVIEMQLIADDGGRRATIDVLDGVARSTAETYLPSRVPDLDADHHEVVLSRLARHPLVRAIRPPIRLAVEEARPRSPSTTASAEPVLPTRQPGAIYPRIGVIDSGVSEVLADWTLDRYDVLAVEECDDDHGTMVAGLLVTGQGMNGPIVAPERDGVEIYDAALFPRDDFLSLYPNGFTDFIAEMASAVAEAKDRHGVRVFNLSINAIDEVEAHRYSLYAARIDEIADAHDVVIVNSIGNLDGANMRRPWQSKPRAVLSYFATRSARDDVVYMPSESVRSLSVGALNPPASGQVDNAPASYSRRGPGLDVGVKPDLAHYGGTCGDGGKPSGLLSLAGDGSVQEIMGTSFAAPMVARIVAGVDAETGGTLSTEALRAMTIHHATPPGPFATARQHAIRTLGRNFCGFGQPGPVADMLETGDHRFTMLFQSRLTMGEKRPAIMRFPFRWPQCLTDADGGCQGQARVTLVYAPPLDPAFGAEFVRVNLDASLAQRQPQDRRDGLPSFLNAIQPDHRPPTKDMGMNEKALIEHGLKWWPVKRSVARFASPKGSSSEWRLEISSLVRAEATFPIEGVRFAVVLSIEDLDGTKPVFGEMRQSVGQNRARTQDIRASTRLRPRGR